MGEYGSLIRGTVVAGHGVASGESGGTRYPGGTIAMQAPHFADRGIDLSNFHPATINLSIAPMRLVLERPIATLRAVEWHPSDPAEDFSFAPCRIGYSRDEMVDGLVYRPHPETKPDHHQPETVVEVLAPFLAGVRPGVELWLAVDPGQARLVPAHGRAGPDSEVTSPQVRRSEMVYGRGMTHEPEYPTIFPALRYDDAGAAIRFLTDALRLTEQNATAGPDGAIVHAELSFGNGVVIVGTRSDPPGPFDTVQCCLYLVTDDPDAHCEKAVAAGAEVVMELTDQEYGSREYAVRDSEGNVWVFGTYQPASS